VQLDTQDCS